MVLYAGYLMKKQKQKQNKNHASTECSTNYATTTSQIPKIF